MLSHTLQKTWNFSVLLRALPVQQSLITLRTCALEVIISQCQCRGTCYQGQYPFLHIDTRKQYASRVEDHSCQCYWQWYVSIVLFGCLLSWSAVDGRVIRTSVCFSVVINHLSTISNVLVHVIDCISLDTGGERSHLLRDLFSGVPDHTLDETLATSDRIEVDLCGGGEESHGCLSITL